MYGSRIAGHVRARSNELYLVPDSRSRQYNSPSGGYSYNGQGQRIRKDQGDFSSTKYEEYVWSDGQVLAQKDQSGAWTDSIYSNKSSVARVDSTAQR